MPGPSLDDTIRDPFDTQVQILSCTPKIVVTQHLELGQWQMDLYKTTTIIINCLCTRGGAIHLGFGML